MVTNTLPTFTITQNDQYVFIKVHVDPKEFNQATAKPEVIVYDSNQFEFFADPYLLRLRFNQEIVNMSNAENVKDVVWSQQGYLCRVKKMQYKQPFTGFENDEAA